MIWLIFNPITLLVLFIIYANTTGIANKIVTVIGGIVDVAVNLTYGTILFMDVPRELLLTKRIERLKSSTGYRGWLANQLCKLLNYIQKDHCV